MAHRYNYYIIRKIPYRKMLNKMRMVELSKQPLSIVYKGKEKNALLAKTKKISVI